MTKLLQAIKYELQRQAFGAPVDQPRVVALIERINEELKLPPYVPQPVAPQRYSLNAWGVHWINETADPDGKWVKWSDVESRFISPSGS